MGTNLSAARHGQVWSAGIDRPETRNALNGPLFEALANTLRVAQADVRIHGLLLHGTSECFCPGHDMARFGALWPQAADGVVARCIEAFADQPKPLVAAVNGAAVGFGATLPAGEAIRRELADLNVSIPAAAGRSIPHA